MEPTLEIFQIQAFVSVVEVDYLPQKDILLRFQLEEMPHIDITTFDFVRGTRRYNIYQGIEFFTRLECFSAFKVLPVYIFLSNLESQIICACGFDLGPLVTDAYRRTYQGIEDVETYQVALQLQDRNDQNYGFIHVEFSVQHFSTDLSKVFCYEEIPSDEIVEEAPELEENEPEPKKKVEKKVNKRKFPRVNPRAADLYLLNKKYLDTKFDLIEQVRDLENQVKRIETSRRRKIYKEKQAKKTMEDQQSYEYYSSDYSVSSIASQKKKPKVNNKTNKNQDFSTSRKKQKTDSQKSRDKQEKTRSQQPPQVQTQVPQLQPQIPQDKPQIPPNQTQIPISNSKQEKQLNSSRSQSSHSSRASKSSKQSAKKVQDVSDNVTQELKASLAKSRESSSGHVSAIQDSSKIESSINSGMNVIDEVASNISHSSHSSHKSNSSQKSNLSHKSNSSHISNSSKISISSNNSKASNSSKLSNLSKISKSSQASKASNNSKTSKNSNISIDSKSVIDNPDIISESFSSSSHTTNAETITATGTTTGKKDDSISGISDSTLGDILGTDHNSDKPNKDDNSSKKSMNSILSKSESSNLSKKSSKSSKSSAREKADTKKEKINIDSDLSSILKDINTNEASSLDSELKAELGLTSSNLNISDINSQSKKDTDKKAQTKTDKEDGDSDSQPKIEDDDDEPNEKATGSTNGTDILSSILSD